MPRKIIKRWMPDDDTFRRHKHLRFLNWLMHDPNLWHLNRYSVSGAAAVGLFMAWVPLPFQMVLAAITAIIFRVNLPISVVLVWITNPITIPPMFFFAYMTGCYVLGQPVLDIDFSISMEAMKAGLDSIWGPLLFGCLIVGIISSLVGYFGMHFLWRLHIISAWRERRRQRKKRKKRESRKSRL